MTTPDVTALRQIPVEQRIYTIRERQIMFENDVATLLNCNLHRLSELVERFPDIFLETGLLTLNQEETGEWAAHMVASFPKNDVVFFKPYCYTQENIVLLSLLLEAEVAWQFALYIIENKEKIELFSRVYRDYPEIFMVREALFRGVESHIPKQYKAKCIPNFPWPKPDEGKKRVSE